MGYQRLGLAALLVSAMRSAVGNPEQETVDSAQQAAIDDVRARFDELTDKLDTIATAVAEGQTLDAAQSEELSGIKGELAEMADALTGPAGDTTDNGVLAEVQVVPTAPTSDTAEQVVSDAINNGIDVPEPTPVTDTAASGGQGEDLGGGEAAERTAE